MKEFLIVLFIILIIYSVIRKVRKVKEYELIDKAIEMTLGEFIDYTKDKFMEDEAEDFWRTYHND